MNDKRKTTGLHDWHIAQRSRMAEFAGFEMPLC